MKVLGTVQVKNGILLLDDSKISVLGGEVDHMMEKWELQRVRKRRCFIPFVLQRTVSVSVFQTVPYSLHRACTSKVVH